MKGLLSVFLNRSYVSVYASIQQTMTVSFADPCLKSRKIRGSPGFACSDCYSLIRFRRLSVSPAAPRLAAIGRFRSHRDAVLRLFKDFNKLL